MTNTHNKKSYIYHCHITDTQFRNILREFCYDSSASETAKRTGVSRNSVNRIYGLLRQRIYEISESQRKEKNRWRY